MLTEKEKMQRAKFYMLKLSQGINPTDNSKIQSDTLSGKERLSKCFEYVVQVLDSAIKNETVTQEKTSLKRGKKPFSITREQLEKVKISADDVVISELVSEINKAVADDSVKKLQAKTVNDWPVREGYLKNSVDRKERTHRELTEKSADIGISSKQGIGAFGKYTIVMYSEQAQKFITENLPKIIADANKT